MTKIPVFTEQEARLKRCPFDNEKLNCVTQDCMSWTESERRIEREDHSGAQMFMIDRQAERAPGSELKREGPPGSTGILFLEARGYCRRLWVGVAELC